MAAHLQTVRQRQVLCFKIVASPWTGTWTGWTLSQLQTSPKQMAESNRNLVEAHLFPESSSQIYLLRHSQFVVYHASVTVL